jgi:hypothetical protein
MVLDNLIAHHEAGHVTLSWLLNEMPEKVTIRPDETSGGHCEYLPVLAGSLVRSAMTGTRKVDQKRIEANLIVRAAGPAAQARYMRGAPVTFIDKGSWETFGGGTDYETSEYLREKTRQRLPGVLSLEDAAEQAHALLRRRDTWESVQRVAAELIRFKTLGYDDLRLLIY